MGRREACDTSARDRAVGPLSGGQQAPSVPTSRLWQAAEKQLSLKSGTNQQFSGKRLCLRIWGQIRHYTEHKAGGGFPLLNVTLCRTFLVPVTGLPPPRERSSDFSLPTTGPVPKCFLDDQGKRSTQGKQMKLKILLNCSIFNICFNNMRAIAIILKQSSRKMDMHATVACA